jgi:hypothetical protein
MGKLVEGFHSWYLILSCCRTMQSDPRFDLPHLRQGRVAAALKLRSNEPVLRVRCVVPPFGSLNSVTAA